MRNLALWLLLLSSLVLPALVPAAEPGPLLARIKAVGKEGQGNVEAAKAWQELVKLGPGALVDVLQALDDADTTAANWLRSAFEAVAERELAAGRPLPGDKLETFVKDRRHAGQARRLAYDWLVKIDARTPNRLLPGMLDDPARELRRDAVALVLQEAEQLLDKKDNAAATKTYQKALAAARDRDQVDRIAGHLKTLGVVVDLPAHFGIIQRWQLIGPFDSTGGVGFKAVYPPERQVDLSASYPGKDGKVVGWREFITTDNYGLVDLNKAIAKFMGAVGYAFAAVESPHEQAVEIRAASQNAVKIFLNGREVFFREEYHHGNRFDGMVGSGTLKAGRNEILIKICQNEQKDDWAQVWGFQARLCDAIGGAIPFKVLPEKPAAANEEKK
jgi:hypothetical protein